MNLLTHPLHSVEEYVDFFSRQTLPVLRHTVREFDAMRKDIDSVSSKHIANVVLSDPLMTMKLLSYLETHRKRSQNHDITTIDRAIIMMGISPFFATFRELSTVEETLSAYPKSLVGVLKVIGRARKAAKHAREWAVIRHDLDVDEITVATLLCQATDIICWIYAPTLMQQVFAMQEADHHMRSADAQRQVFGFPLSEIQFAVVQAWKLPELLVHLLDESRIDHPRVRTITLAADFTRHVARGWDDAALPDDIAAISALLHITPEALLRRLDVPADAVSRFLPAPS